MTIPRRPYGTDPNDIPTHAILDKKGGGSSAVLLSATALAFSAFSLYDTSLKQADLRVFVPAVISYGAPYNNDTSNFEMFGVPVTLANDGARTGVIVGVELAVTNLKTNQTKRFYAAEFGRWTMEKTRSGAYEAFSPISLAGRSSRADQILFYTRGDAEKPNAIVDSEPGSYRFKLDVTEADGGGWFGSLWPKRPISVTFERDLPFYDARAFQNGTLPLYSSEWRAATGAGAPSGAAP